MNFFASWCAPCVAEMPAFEAVKSAVGGDVAFVGINVQDRIEDGELATLLAAHFGVEVRR